MASFIQLCAGWLKSPLLMKIVIASIKEHVSFFTHLINQDSQTNFEFVEHAGDFIHNSDADAFIDLSFNGDFFSPPHKPLLIGETIKTLKQLDPPCKLIGRFCEWKGFPERDCWEIATTALNVEWLDVLMGALGKNWKHVADEPGLVAPRILSMIINEAFFVWEEGVSSVSQVDQAMKLGTNYPEGPFEWGKKIGFKNIIHLLGQLAISDKSYTPNTLLLNNSM
jgi:3-hydroxybutyryl-CoA dehydrogenase